MNEVVLFWKVFMVCTMLGWGLAYGVAQGINDAKLIDILTDRGVGIDHKAKWLRRMNAGAMMFLILLLFAVYHKWWIAFLTGPAIMAGAFMVTHRWHVNIRRKRHPKPWHYVSTSNQYDRVMIFIFGRSAGYAAYILECSVVITGIVLSFTKLPYLNG